MSSFKRINDELFIGPQPTEQDLQAAQQQGIKTVIDFRLPSETQTSNAALTTRHGLAYVNIPVNKEALSADQVDELERALQTHAGPFLLHCATGARAALLLTVSRAKRQGWTSVQALDDAQRMGFDLRASAPFSAWVGQTLD